MCGAWGRRPCFVLVATLLQTQLVSAGFWSGSAALRTACPVLHRVHSTANSAAEIASSQSLDICDEFNTVPACNTEMKKQGAYSTSYCAWAGAPFVLWRQHKRASGHMHFCQ